MNPDEEDSEKYARAIDAHRDDPEKISGIVGLWRKHFGDAPLPMTAAKKAHVAEVTRRGMVPETTPGVNLREALSPEAMARDLGAGLQAAGQEFSLGALGYLEDKTGLMSRDEQARLAERHPVANVAGKISGMATSGIKGGAKLIGNVADRLVTGILPTAAQSMAGKMAMGAATGGIGGELTEIARGGFDENTRTESDKGRSMLLGLGMGGLLGGFAPYIASKLANPLTKTGKAITERAAVTENMSPERAQTLKQQMARLPASDEGMAEASMIARKAIDARNAQLTRGNRVIRRMGEEPTMAAADEPTFASGEESATVVEPGIAAASARSGANAAKAARGNQLLYGKNTPEFTPGPNEKEAASALLANGGLAYGDRGERLAELARMYPEAMALPRAMAAREALQLKLTSKFPFLDARPYMQGRAHEMVSPDFGVSGMLNPVEAAYAEWQRKRAAK